MNLAGLNSLVIEQVPKHKGTMMSVNGVFQSVGLVLGIALGGLVLNSFVNNFQLLMTIFGVLALFSVPILIFIAKDPCVAGAPV
jgi:MFS family permease